MDYTIIDAHAHLWLLQDTVVNGLPINAMPSDFDAVIRYLRRGNCPTEKLISRIVTPSEAGEALQRWAANPGKIFRILTKF